MKEGMRRVEALRRECLCLAMNAVRWISPVWRNWDVRAWIWGCVAVRSARVGLMMLSVIHAPLFVNLRRSPAVMGLVPSMSNAVSPSWACCRASCTLLWAISEGGSVQAWGCGLEVRAGWGGWLGWVGGAVVGGSLLAPSFAWPP